MYKNAKHEFDKRKAQRRQANLYWKKDRQWYLWFQEMDDEAFKQVPGYHGFYFISNYGRMVSFHQKEPVEIRRTFKNNCLTAVLTLDGRREEFKVDELVYHCFVGPIRQHSVLVHINGNNRDNYYKNLRLNLDRRKSNRPAPPVNEAERRRNSKPPKEKSRGTVPPHEVLQFDLHGHFIRKHASIDAAAAAVNVEKKLIGNCCKLKRRSAGGHQWFFHNHSMFSGGIKDIPPVKVVNKGIFQFSMEGEFIRHFPTQNEAARVLKIPGYMIQDNLRFGYASAGGFRFRYVSDPLFREGICNISPTPEGKPHRRSRAVLKFDLWGRFIAEYPSPKEASIQCGIGAGNLCHCLKGKRLSVGAFQWRYRDDPRFNEGVTDIEKAPLIFGRQCPEVLQFDLEGKFIKKFPNARTAAEEINRDERTIILCTNGKVRTCAGYQWRSVLNERFKDGITDIGPVRYSLPSNYKPVLKFSRMGRLVAEFPSIQQAAEDAGVDSSTITQYIRTGRVPETAEFYYEFKNMDKKEGQTIPPPKYRKG